MKYSWSGPSGAGVISSIDHAEEELLRHESTKHVDTNRLHRCPTKRGKRFRSAFTTEQINYLEKQFKKVPYVGNGQRKEIANNLNISERSIKIWFQNRRMKEKKDGYDEQNVRKTGELIKDQLNNVSNLPNDKQALSLPILDTDLTNIDRKANVDTSYSGSKSQPDKLNYYEETLSKDQAMTCNIVQRQTSPATSIKLNKSPDFKTSAEFSIGLCKKYKIEAKTTNFEHVKIENKPEIKHQPQSNIQFNNVSNMNPVQDSPEDLSSWKKTTLQSQNDNLPGTVTSNNAEYLPVIPSFYAQPYLSSGNMIWKPINVTPVMSTRAPAVTITSNQPESLTPGSNVQTKNCTCNCHVTTPVPQFPLGFQGPGNPQYIITAVPFQNAATMFQNHIN